MEVLLVIVGVISLIALITSFRSEISSRTAKLDLKYVHRKLGYIQNKTEDYYQIKTDIRELQLNKQDKKSILDKMNDDAMRQEEVRKIKYDARSEVELILDKHFGPNWRARIIDDLPPPGYKSNAGLNKSNIDRIREINDRIEELKAEKKEVIEDQKRQRKAEDELN